MWSADTPIIDYDDFVCSVYRRISKTLQDNSLLSRLQFHMPCCFGFIYQPESKVVLKCKLMSVEVIFNYRWEENYLRRFETRARIVIGIWNTDGKVQIFFDCVWADAIVYDWGYQLGIWRHFWRPFIPTFWSLK